MQLKLIIKTENVKKVGYVKLFEEIEEHILKKIYDTSKSVRGNARDLKLSHSTMRSKVSKYNLVRKESNYGQTNIAYEI